MERKLAFNCKTLEDAQDFIYQCVKRDIQVWRCANWDVNKENTCFEIKDNRLMYGCIEFFVRDAFEIVTYEKGDSIFGVKYEKLKGNGQCTCAKCKSINWTEWCYKVYDKSNEFYGKILCSKCANEFI